MCIVFHGRLAPSTAWLWLAPSALLDVALLLSNSAWHCRDSVYCCLTLHGTVGTLPTIVWLCLALSRLCLLLSDSAWHCRDSAYCCLTLPGTAWLSWCQNGPAGRVGSPAKEVNPICREVPSVCWLSPPAGLITHQFPFGGLLCFWLWEGWGGGWVVHSGTDVLYAHWLKRLPHGIAENGMIGKALIRKGCAGQYPFATMLWCYT